MEEWEITPCPKKGTLDIAELKRRVFTKYLTIPNH